MKKPKQNNQKKVDLPKNTDPYFWTKKDSDEEYRNMRAQMFDRFGI